MLQCNKMKNKIILYITLMFLLVNIANAEKYFVLDVNHIIDSVTFNSISLKEIDRTIKYNGKSGFLIKTVSFENTEINSIYYNMSENQNYLVYIPYSKNAAKIEMYNIKNSKIMDIDVSSFSNTCGNSICEEHESYESCTADCSSGSKDDFCDGISDGICDPDCSLKTDIDCKGVVEEGNETITPITKEKVQKIELEQPKEKPNYLIWILLFSFIVIFVLLFLFIKKRKETQIIDSLKQYISENIRRGFTLQQIKQVLYREGYTEKEIDKAIKAI